MKKYRLLFDEREFPPISLGIEVGIFYAEDYSKHDSYSSYQKLYLFTLCYRPRYKDFIQIRYVNLPKRLIHRYKDIYNDEKTINELEEIGIHNYNKVVKVIEEYHDYQDLLVYEKYKSSLQETDDEVYNKLLEVKDAIEAKKVLKKIN